MGRYTEDEIQKIGEVASLLADRGDRIEADVLYALHDGLCFCTSDHCDADCPKCYDFSEDEQCPAKVAS